jgi:hypothetical protein
MRIGYSRLVGAEWRGAAAVPSILPCHPRTYGVQVGNSNVHDFPSATEQTHTYHAQSRISQHRIGTPAMAGNGSSILEKWTLLDFDFTSDCNRTARFYYANRLENHYVWFSNTLEFFPYAEFIDFVRHAAPDPFANVSRGVIVDWIDGLDFYIQDANEQLWSKKLPLCDPEFCQSLDWQGNPDLAGIGVSDTDMLPLPCL